MPRETLESLAYYLYVASKGESPAARASAALTAASQVSERTTSGSQDIFLRKIQNGNREIRGEHLDNVTF